MQNFKQPSPHTRKPYTPPQIIYELELETRAGSTLPPDGLEGYDPLDLTGTGETFP